MTRLTETEIAIIQRSKAQAAGDWMELDRVLWEARRARARYMNEVLAKAWQALGLGTLICAARRALARRRTLAELNALDSRQLRDIGMERADIGRIAVETSRSAHPYPASWISRLGAELKRAAARRQSIAQLSSLDDRILQDIGIERAMITEMVDARMQERGAVWQLEDQQNDEKPGFTVKLGAALLLPLYLLVKSAANSNEPIIRQAA